MVIYLYNTDNNFSISLEVFSITKVEGVKGTFIFFIRVAESFTAPSSDCLLRANHDVGHVTSVVGHPLVLVSDHNVSAHKAQIIHQALCQVFSVWFRIRIRIDERVFSLRSEGFSIKRNGGDQDVVLVVEVEHIETIVAPGPVHITAATIVVGGDLPETVRVDLVHFIPQLMGHVKIAVTRVGAHSRNSISIDLRICVPLILSFLVVVKDGLASFYQIVIELALHNWPSIFWLCFDSQVCWLQGDTSVNKRQDVTSLWGDIISPALIVTILHITTIEDIQHIAAEKPWVAIDRCDKHLYSDVALGTRTLVSKWLQVDISSRAIRIGKISVVFLVGTDYQLLILSVSGVARILLDSIQDLVEVELHIML